eukprot:6657158-Prymnesium_polylepis.1
MVRVHGIFEVTHSTRAVLQGLARVARVVRVVRVARLGVWLDAWKCLDVVRTWYRHLGRLAASGRCLDVRTSGTSG